MIHVYTWPTPNGHKIHIMAEECGLAYEVHAVHIGKGEQFTPEFLKISPNNKTPAIVDDDGPGGRPISMMESGAILIYLANKTGKFLPRVADDPAVATIRVMEWLMFQMGHIGPMLGQTHHFRDYAPEKIAYAIDRYTNEAKRLYNVVDKRLSQSAYLAGDDYTIADIATFPWLRFPESKGQTMEDFPHLKRWFDAIAGRPAVVRGVAVLAELRRPGPIKQAEREVLFGATQHARH